jgi:hypothetical protein
MPAVALSDIPGDGTYESVENLVTPSEARGLS